MTSSQKNIINYNEIDQEIKPWVQFLRAHDFITFGSCQWSSHNDDHMSRIPYVGIDADDGKTLEETAERLRNLISSRNLVTISGQTGAFRAHIKFYPYLWLLVLVR